MLFSLYKATLDDEIRRGLESSAYSEMEIEGVRCKLRRQIEERTRATSGVLALFAAFDAMLVMTKSSVPVLIAMLVVEGLALYAAWYLQAGCLKRVSGVRSFEAVRRATRPANRRWRPRLSCQLKRRHGGRQSRRGYNPQNLPRS